jgi:hypothetical protein
MDELFRHAMYFTSPEGVLLTDTGVSTGVERERRTV